MTDLSDIWEIARACGRPRKTGKGVAFLCPCHQERNPSCTAILGDHAVIVRCFAGCDKHDVMDALRAMGFTLSLGEHEGERRDLSKVTAMRRAIDRDTQVRTELARRLWHEARSIKASPAERYLQSRGLSLGGVCDLDLALRFHPNCPRGKARHWAMLAAFRDIATNEVVAVHRIFLDRNSRKLDKMMLGPPSEAAIKLSSHALTFNARHFCERLHVCEGVETGIGARMLGYAPVWALGTASLIAALPPLLSVGELVVLADHDGAGIKAATACVEIWRGAGWRARVVMPEREGWDFADVAANGLEATGRETV